MLLHEVVDRLSRLERRICQIYAALARRCEFPTALRSLWRKMAEDENCHRAYMEQTAGLLNFLISPPEQEALAAFSHIEAVVTAAEAFVEQAELSVDDALRHALCLEGSELDNLEDTWLHGFHPPLASLTHASFPDQESHLRRLYDAVRTYSVDPALHVLADALWEAHQQCKSDTAGTDMGGPDDVAR